MAERRSKRARVVDYAALDSGEFIEGVDEFLPKSPNGANATSVDYKKWSKLILKGEYGEKTKVLDAKPEELEDVVRGSGFQNPILVKRAGEQGLRRLGIRLPEGELTVDRISDLVGPDHPIPTIDVASQAEGPKWTIDQWRYYWNLAPIARKKLLNVVSLGLFGTPMEAQVTAPSVVRDMDLVGRVWPLEDFYAPKVQLYVLMSPQGSYTDFHVDMGGSSVWYHLVGGKKVFLIAPPSAKNLEAFEEWASSDKQGSVFFGSKGEGWRRVEMEAGDTLLMPGGWPHAVVTPEDSIAVGGNFQTGQNFTAQVNVWKLEDRLRVRPKFRYPSFKRLMWYAAYYYFQRLYEDHERTGGDHHSLSRWEASGLRALLGLLKGWQVQSRGDQSDVPPLITSADILLHELEELLPPPPSPRLITIKRTDSSASGLDRSSSEKSGKPKLKSQSRPPPRPAHKGLGVKGRLLAKLGMRRSQPILSLPRIHTDKPPLKVAAPSGDTSANQVSDVSKSRLSDVSKSRLGALRIDVGAGPGEAGERNGSEGGKGERYVRKSEPTSGSGNANLIRIPKVVIRGVRGLGSPRGTLGEEPRSRLGESPRGLSGVAQKGDASQVCKVGVDAETGGTGTKRKQREEVSDGTGRKSDGTGRGRDGSSDGTGSDSLGASENDFAKLLIRLGKRTAESDTTSRSESPFSEPARGADVSISGADILMHVATSAADVSQRGGEGGAVGVLTEGDDVPGKRPDAFAAGHELSRFAAACLMTSADGATNGENALGVAGDTGRREDDGNASPRDGLPGSRLTSAEESGSPGYGLPGSHSGPSEEGVRPGDGTSGTPADVERGGPTAMMRGFLSSISGGEETRPDRPGGNKGSVQTKDLRSPTAVQSQPGRSPVGNPGLERKADARGATSDSVSGTPRSPGAANALRITTAVQKPVPGMSGRVLSPTGGLLSPRGGLLSPRRPPLPGGILDRCASRLTLGMKSAGQKRRVVMLTEVTPDPEVLAQRAKADAAAAAAAAAEARKLAIGRKADVGVAAGDEVPADGTEAMDGRGLEVPGAGGELGEVAELEGLGRSQEGGGVERDGVLTSALVSITETDRSGAGTSALTTH